MRSGKNGIKPQTVSIITPQHTRELWGYLEGMSVVNIHKQKVVKWLKTFPGALNDLGDVPIIKRDK
ncbi:hypothetical protein CEJ32_12435 [Enterobacter sp. 9-2]|nr:hypothetical protein CEJ32_12435 [Enterobacter sp. 9-2]